MDVSSGNCTHEVCGGVEDVQYWNVVEHVEVLDEVHRNVVLHRGDYVDRQQYSENKAVRYVSDISRMKQWSVARKLFECKINYKACSAYVLYCDRNNLRYLPMCGSCRYGANNGRIISLYTRVPNLWMLEVHLHGEICSCEFVCTHNHHLRRDSVFEEGYVREICNNIVNVDGA
ncbi:uncharacterized protein LOC112904189 [Agrilus planipennis]|uniref:Uncharacterized protein LOC112904189 n=1 Tax=Agrilus planipennis TaxID=224129 RepID=A0A7F5R289_AGRPL|nr:uncharacterized protein LOC112904189 [Agrilus planipennis]